MADYTRSKLATKSNSPVDAVDAQEWSRNEPLLSVEQLRDRVLFGITLASETPDPITKRRAVMSDELLKDYIIGAVSRVELDTGLVVLPVKFSESHPFDRNHFMQWGYLKVNRTPVLSVDRISVKPGTKDSIYDVPIEWISPGYFKNGQLNVVPIMPIMSTNFSLSPAGQGGGAVFLAFLNQLAWIPAFWEVEYTTGFAGGNVPRILNEIIGCYAGIEVLAQLAATATSNSRSLGLDGLSQSVSTPGPSKYDVRIKILEDKKQNLLKKVRALYGKKFIIGTL